MYINPEIRIVDETKEKQKFFCDICEFPLLTMMDFSSEREYGCCNECYLTFAEARRKAWKEGWRPEESAVEEYIYLRKKANTGIFKLSE
jgi:hypothetical protein